MEQDGLKDTPSSHFRDFWELFDEHREELDEAVFEIAVEIPGLSNVAEEMSDEERAASRAESRRLHRAALLDGEWDALLEHQRLQGAAYARRGVEFGSWFHLLTSFRKLVSEKLAAECDERDHLLRALSGMNAFFDVSMGAIGEAYLDTKEEVIGRQQAAIRELSTPVLQVREGLLILPILGLIDTHRARALTEDLLLEIRDRRASVVVMDITGVPMVDSRVANHLVQTVDAARLMGATVILTGIAPEIARTLVAIGAELSTIDTLGDLQAGLEKGIELLESDERIDTEELRGEAV